MQNEASIERQRIEWVFGLTGGELADGPLTARAPYSSGSGTLDASYAYWYEGAPDYLGESGESDLGGNDSWDCLTTVILDAYLSSAPQWLVTDAGAYMLLGTYTNSGECRCPGSDDDETSGRVTATHCASNEDCVLCEEPIGSDHGYIYIGEGMEAVYVLVPESQTDREEWAPCDVCHKVTHEDNLTDTEAVESDYPEAVSDVYTACDACRREAR